MENVSQYLSPTKISTKTSAQDLQKQNSPLQGWKGCGTHSSILARGYILRWTPVNHLIIAENERASASASRPSLQQCQTSCAPWSCRTRQNSCSASRVVKVVVPRDLFRRILELIDDLRSPEGSTMFEPEPEIRRNSDRRHASGPLRNTPRRHRTTG